MIKFNEILIIVVLFFMFNLSFSQNSKHIKVSFVNKNIELDSVKYYLINGKRAYLLNQTDSELILNESFFKDNEDIKFLATFKNSKIEFYVKPKSMLYLKISKLPFSFKNLFKTRYSINQGFDYEEIVSESKTDYILINCW